MKFWETEDVDTNGNKRLKRERKREIIVSQVIEKVETKRRIEKGMTETLLKLR